MATPSLQKSFDTSLIDVNKSFSSTETNTSGSGSSAKENQPPAGAPYRPLDASANARSHAQWVSTPDTIRTVVQAIDDIEAAITIPALHHGLESRKPTRVPLRILELGCGAGRTTLKLIRHQWKQPVAIEAWDTRQEMIVMAESKCRATVSEKRDVMMTFRCLDICDTRRIPEGWVAAFDIIVSSLVLEHVPLEIYWSQIRTLLKPGGAGALSSRHPDIDAGHAVGFQDAAGGRSIGSHHSHGIQDTIDCGTRAGLVIEDVKETAVDEALIARREIGEGARSWIGKKVWYGMKFRMPG